MAQDTPSRHLDQFLVRFPEGMRDRIAEAAKSNQRSMNAEIVDRLKKSFDSYIIGTEVTELRQQIQSETFSMLKGLIEFIESGTLNEVMEEKKRKSEAEKSD